MYDYNENCLPDLPGVTYIEVLKWLHTLTKPSLYFEIGTLTGGTLQLSSCSSIAVDPDFHIHGIDVIGSKPALHLYQQTSDQFFKANDILREESIDFAFLDGMHQAEFLLRDFYSTESFSRSNAIIVMHDCIPVEIPMTCREQFGFISEMPHRAGWWTGDVWRVIVALKHFRPDLKITCLDAAPTGLVVVTGLSPKSNILTSRYDEICRFMQSLELRDITVRGLHENMNVMKTPSKEVLLETLRV